MLKTIAGESRLNRRYANYCLGGEMLLQTGIVAPLIGEVAGLIVEANDGSMEKKRLVAASATVVSAAVIGAATVDPGGAAIACVAALAQGLSENGSIVSRDGQWNEMGKAFGNLLMG